MRQHGTRNKVLDRLLASLASAEKGSRELDIIMSFVLGETSGETGKMVELLVEEGYPWEIVSELLDRDLPAYTTSLDAAIPGENIVLAAHSARRGLWGAAHRRADGEHVWRWAATECLARRLAALSALMSSPAAPRGETGVAAGTAGPRESTKADELNKRGTEASETGKDSKEDAETEWKILF